MISRRRLVSFVDRERSLGSAGMASGARRGQVKTGRIVVAVVLAVVVGVLAAVWPAIRAARLPVLDAISYE